MKEVKKADFKLERYHIARFSFEEPDDSVDNLNLDFDPSGVFNENTGMYQLHLKFSAIALSKSNEAKETITATLLAFFNFPSLPNIDDLPDYFYQNSIAIVFPYLRAFISTLTLQANVRLLIMPLLNLSNLEERLRQHTRVIKREIVE